MHACPVLGGGGRGWLFSWVVGWEKDVRVPCWGRAGFDGVWKSNGCGRWITGL